MALRTTAKRPAVSKIGNRCKCCAKKNGVSDAELFGEGDLFSHVDVFLDGDREGWTMRQEYYEQHGFSRQRRCQVWDNPSLDKWILLKFKGQKIKEAMTGDGIDNIRIGKRGDDLVEGMA